MAQNAPWRGVQGDPDVQSSGQSARRPVGAGYQLVEFKGIVSSVPHAAKHHVESIAGGFDVLWPLHCARVEICDCTQKLIDEVRRLVFAQRAVADRIRVNTRFAYSKVAELPRAR